MSKDKDKSENYKDQESVKDQMEGVIDDAIDEVEEGEDENQEEELSESEELRGKLDQEKDKFLRLFAEFENYKRRTSKERTDLFKTASQDVIQAMLPVLDDFDRAMVEIEKGKDKDLMDGVKLISNKLRETLFSKRLIVNEGEARRCI